MTGGHLIGSRYPDGVAESKRPTVSPEPLAEDLRSADDRDLPSRTDVFVAELSQVVGGPVGRPALIGQIGRAHV